MKPEDFDLLEKKLAQIAGLLKESSSGEEETIDSLLLQAKGEVKELEELVSQGVKQTERGLEIVRELKTKVDESEKIDEENIDISEEIFNRLKNQIEKQKADNKKINEGLKSKVKELEIELDKIKMGCVKMEEDNRRKQKTIEELEAILKVSVDNLKLYNDNLIKLAKGEEIKKSSKPIREIISELEKGSGLQKKYQSRILNMPNVGNFFQNTLSNIADGLGMKSEMKDQRGETSEGFGEESVNSISVSGSRGVFGGGNEGFTQDVSSQNELLAQQEVPSK